MWSSGVGIFLADLAVVRLTFPVIIANSTHTD